MTRFRKLALIAVVGLVLLVWAVVSALPGIIRRVAVDRISRQTGRAAAIEGIDLNLLSGHVVVRGFRLADREGPEPFVEFERLDVRLGLLDLFRSHVYVRELTLVAPSFRVIRLGPAEFNFSDLVSGPKEPVEPPSPVPSRWTVTIESVNIRRGRAQVVDRAVSPLAEWLVQGLEVDARRLTTRAGAVPGQLSVQAQINESRLALEVERLRLAPLQLAARLTFEGFETRRLDPYVYRPLGTPYRPKGGRFQAALTAHVDSDSEEIQKAVLSGTLSLEGEALVPVGRPDPFASASRLRVEIKEADMVARTLTLANVAIEGLDVTARRDTRGVIDLLEMFTPKALAAPAPTKAGGPAGVTPPAAGSPPRSEEPSAAPPGRGAPSASPPVPPSAGPERRTLFPLIQGLARGFEEIRVERITLGPSRATFIDAAVKPATRLVLTDLQARVDNFTWPVRAPATVAASTTLPGGGTLNLKGSVTMQPFDAALTMAIRDAPVEPYQAYIPVPARVSGRYGGDSQNRIAIRDGTLVAQSRGNSWAQNVEVREPAAERPAFRVERMDLIGIDFEWPTRAAVVSAGFRRFRMEVERGADGSISLRRLFTTPEPAVVAPPALSPTASPAGPKPKARLETMHLEFREVRIDDGFVYFLDRTTQPAFSQDLSRLMLRITDLGNRPDRPARLELQGVVGGDAALDIRGEIGTLGAPAPLDLVGELRSFRLPSLDPYASAAVGWVVKRGDLQYKFRFKMDGNELSADNEVVIGQLQVAPASGGDEVKRRIGLPLELIVALIKDRNGDIRVNVPVTGSVNHPQFSFRDAIWTAVKNMLSHVVAAPFTAIGRLVSGGGTGEKIGEPKIDPVTFAAGSSVLSPAMEDHLLGVADFLRGAPFVNLALTSVPNRADVDALTQDALTARVQEFQKARGLPDPAVALAEYYKTQFPDVPLPETAKEQATRLLDREPAPDAQLVELGRRRLQATRERLLSLEGIRETRLTASTAPPAGTPAPTPAAPSPEATGGRVEFAIVVGE